MDGQHNPHTKLKKFETSFEESVLGMARNAVYTYIDAFKKYAIASHCDIEDRACQIPDITNHSDFVERYLRTTSFVGLLNETVSFDGNGDIRNKAFEIYGVSRRKNKFVRIAKSIPSSQGLFLLFLLFLLSS